MISSGIYIYTYVYLECARRGGGPNGPPSREANPHSNFVFNGIYIYIAK